MFLSARVKAELWEGKGGTGGGRNSAPGRFWREEGTKYSVHNILYCTFFSKLQI